MKKEITRRTFIKGAAAGAAGVAALGVMNLPVLAQEEVTNLFGTALLEQPQAFTAYETVRAVARAGDTLYIRTTSYLYTFSPGDTAAQKRVFFTGFRL